MGHPLFFRDLRNWHAADRNPAVGYPMLSHHQRSDGRFAAAALSDKGSQLILFALQAHILQHYSFFIVRKAYMFQAKIPGTEPFPAFLLFLLSEAPTDEKILSLAAIPFIAIWKKLPSWRIGIKKSAAISTINRHPESDTFPPPAASPQLPFRLQHLHRQPDP